MSTMIDLYTMATPNGVKVSIALEELGLAYNLHTINILNGDQFSDSYIKINPNSKIPAIVDPNGPNGQSINVMESGAILLYLAEKHGKLMSSNLKLRYETMQWLFFQVGSIGPMFGQFGHFYRYAKEKCDHPYPIERYSKESKRLLQVLEQHLSGRQVMVGQEFSIADIAIFPWVDCLRTFYQASEHLQLSQYPQTFAWVDRCLARPAVQRGMLVGEI